MNNENSIFLIEQYQSQSVVENVHRLLSAAAARFNEQQIQYLIDFVREDWFSFYGSSAPSQSAASTQAQSANTRGESHSTQSTSQTVAPEKGKSLPNANAPVQLRAPAPPPKEPANALDLDRELLVKQRLVRMLSRCAREAKDSHIATKILYFLWDLAIATGLGVRTSRAIFSFLFED